jgi:hypothetical protein
MQNRARHEKPKVDSDSRRPEGPTALHLGRRGSQNHPTASVPGECTRAPLLEIMHPPRAKAQPTILAPLSCFGRVHGAVYRGGLHGLIKFGVQAPGSGISQNAVANG